MSVATRVFADLVWDPKDGLSQSLSRAKIAKWPEQKMMFRVGVKKKNTTWKGRRSPPFISEKYGSTNKRLKLFCCWSGDVEKVFDIALSRAWPSDLRGCFLILILIVSNPMSITPSLTPIHAFGPCWMQRLQRWDGGPPNWQYLRLRMDRWKVLTVEAKKLPKN